MKKLLLITILLLTSLICSPATDEKLRFQDKIVINSWGFEDKNDIREWESTRGHLILSGQHFKQGESSLLWQWKKGDRLQIAHLQGLERAGDFYPGGQPEIYEPAFYKKAQYGGFKLWLYQEKANKGRLHFQVGSDVHHAEHQPKYKFSISLDFTGWRSVWVQLNEDAAVQGYTGSDAMKSLVLIPEADVKNGELYLDHLFLLDFVSYKRHSDLIFENKKSPRRVDSYEILEPYKKYLAINSETDDAACHSEDFDRIEKRLETLILGEGDVSWKNINKGFEQKLSNSIKKAGKYYETLNIKRSDGSITGLPLFTCRDEHPTADALNYQAVIENTFFPLSFDYRSKGNERSKEQFMDILAHLNDQGWVAGSALGTVDHIIRLNGYAVGVFLLKDEMDAATLKQQQECLAWHTRMGNIIDLNTARGENTDLVRGGALAKLISVLLMPDSPRKDKLMKAFKNYVDYVVKFAPGYSDTMKPDYSIFHHRGTYLNAYGISAINSIALIDWLLKDTEYAMAAESRDILKKTLKRQYEIAYGVDLHPAVCGRFPYKNSGIDRFLLPAYAFMSTEDNEIEDPEMAAIFNYLFRISKPQNLSAILIPALTYSGSCGTLNLMAQLNRKMGDAVLPPKDGHYTMPYSGFAVHRRGDWLSAVKGYDKYVWDYETGHKGENNLGRYLSHGTMFLLKNGSEKGFHGAGIRLNDGFHWGYMPGATTKALPIEDVFFVNKPTEKYIEGFHRSFSEASIARGLSAEGKNGLFALDLRDNVGPAKEKTLFDNTFRAHKTYFFFDDEIICLGSNISNEDQKNATITTLFQYHADADNQSKTAVNGTSIGADTDIELTLNGGMLTDVQGIHYILPPTNKIRLTQKPQDALKKENNGKYVPLSAPHVKAWINHGKAPIKESYEYLILMNQSTDEALLRRENPGYEVLQQNSVAHIIKHTAQKTTAYAIFQAKQFQSKGILKQSDTPLLLMYRDRGEKALISVANPDLKLKEWNHNMSVMPANIVHESSKGAVTNFTIEGHWSLAGYVYEVLSVEQNDNHTTSIKVYSKDSKSIDIPLRKSQAIFKGDLNGF